MELKIAPVDAMWLFSVCQCKQGKRNVFKTGQTNLDRKDYAINVWVADNFMTRNPFSTCCIYYNVITLKCLKSHSTLLITLLLHNRIPCEHNNKWTAWAADNLAPLDMPFLSIIT